MPRSPRARELARLFALLAEPDELARSYHTSPARARIDTPTGPIDAVAISGGTAEDPILVEGDPVACIRAAMLCGPARLLIKAGSHYILGELAAGSRAIGQINQAAVRAQDDSVFA